MTWEIQRHWKRGDSCLYAHTVYLHRVIVVYFCIQFLLFGVYCSAALYSSSCPMIRRKAISLHVREMTIKSTCLCRKLAVVSAVGGIWERAGEVVREQMHALAIGDTMALCTVAAVALIRVD